MDFIGIIILLLGLGVTLASTVWLVVLAFKNSAGWGIASIFVPFGVFFFVAMNWRESCHAFFIWNAGFLVLVFGMLLCSQMGS